MKPVTRIILFIFFIVGVYLVPWWVLFTFAFVVMLFKRTLLPELIIPAFVIDVVYGVPIDRFGNFQFVATLIMVLVLIVVFVIKRYVRN